MKKYISLILAAVLILTLFVGCYADEGDVFAAEGRFVVVDHDTSSSNINSYILVDEETNVLYLVVYTTMYRMGITVLLNADGTPMTMEDISE